MTDGTETAAFGYFVCCDCGVKIDKPSLCEDCRTKRMNAVPESRTTTCPRCGKESREGDVHTCTPEGAKEIIEREAKVQMRSAKNLLAMLSRKSRLS